MWELSVIGTKLENKSKQAVSPWVSSFLSNEWWKLGDEWWKHQNPNSPKEQQMWNQLLQVWEEEGINIFENDKAVQALQVYVYLESWAWSWTIRAFAFSIANAICKRILALIHQTSPASGLANTNYCKKICNSATVQFYL